MSRLFKCFVTLYLLSAPIFANTVTIGDNAGFNRFPFGYDNSSVSNYKAGAEYQQLYSAIDFPNSPVAITQLAFATSPFLSNATLASYSIDVHLGVAAATADNPSNTFSANKGASYRDVFNSTITFVPNKTNTFDMLVNLSAPYLYTPAAGGLLLDITFNAAPVITGTLLEFASQSSDTDSRVYNINSGALTGSVDQNTLYTRVTYTLAAVPEPRTSATLVLACAFLLLIVAAKAQAAQRL